MKKCTILLLSLVLLMTTSLFAGSLDSLSNLSERFMMTTSRNAATDAADIAAYNPAGIVFMPKGLHVDLSVQTLLKYYEQKANMGPSGKSFEQDLPTWALPNLYVVYNFGDVGPGILGLYFTGGVPAGGGNLDWDGTAGVNAQLAQMGTPYSSVVASQSFKASSIYYGIGLGGAYSFLDEKMSVSLGGRLVIARRGFEMSGAFTGGGLNGMSANVEFDYNALGFTPILGIDVRPIDKLTLAARYEYTTALKFKYDEKDISGTGAITAGTLRSILTGVGLEDGKKFNQNLPHTIGLGAEYQFTDAFALSLSGTAYLLNVTNLGKYKDGTNDKDINDLFGIGWEAALGGTYKLNDSFKFGAGVMYTESGAKDSYFNKQGTLLNASGNPPLDSIAIGLGAAYSFNFGLDVNLGMLYSQYLSKDYGFSVLSGTYKKRIIGIGLGLGYHY
ncbi:MAG: outer membrane protein transport protein [Treponema sp.]|jgi:long-chain fatty acid transport protein|nr:outer membrane protein transport protein [Treponema sp.]